MRFLFHAILILLFAASQSAEAWPALGSGGHSKPLACCCASVASSCNCGCESNHAPSDNPSPADAVFCGCGKVPARLPAPTRVIEVRPDTCGDAVFVCWVAKPSATNSTSPAFHAGLSPPHDAAFLHTFIILI